MLRSSVSHFTGDPICVGCEQHPVVARLSMPVLPRQSGRLHGEEGRESAIRKFPSKGDGVFLESGDGAPITRNREREGSHEIDRQHRSHLFDIVQRASLALFESDKELSEKARITMVEALKTAQKEVPGKPVEVTMGKDDGRVVYKIEIIDKNKNTKKVYIDAVTGKVHTVKD